MTQRLTRRQFISMATKAGIAAGASMAVPWAFDVRSAYAFSQSPLVRKFVTTLPGRRARGREQHRSVPAAGDQDDFDVRRPHDGRLQPGSREVRREDAPGSEERHAVAGATTTAATGDQKYLGGVIVAKRGTPVMLNVTNQLPTKAIIPIDPTIMAGPNGVMVGDLPLNRTAVHLHGGFTPWFSDGTPLQWFDPKGAMGASFMNIPGTNPPKGTANYYYPMDQSARFVWYHDHAMGITRTNAYSGIASALLVIDDFEIGWKPRRSISSRDRPQSRCRRFSS